MKPNTHTVQELFERDIRYVVPLYQRPYVWKEEEQWEPLWEDISTLLAHYEEAGSGDVSSHFLGAIVVEQDQTAPGQIPQYTVIDGQQRLTTLQILLAAAAAALAAAKHENDAALLRELVINNPLKAKGEKRLKVWPTNVNRAAFVAAVDGVSAEYPEDLILPAFRYFSARAAEYLAGDEPVETEVAEERASRLRVALTYLLKVVSITLEQGDNAQVIFETLNARGTPLLSLDLVKNALFRQASAQGRDTDSLHEEVWRPQLEQQYWRATRRQGRLNRPVGELFLMHWLTMELARVTPATELFATFRQNMLKKDTDAESLIRRLCADASIMRSLDDLAPESPERIVLDRLLGPLDAGTMLPVVLFLFRTPEISRTRRVRAMRILESWLARRVLLRLTSKNYNRSVPRLLTVMKEDPARADDLLLAELSRNDSAVSRWPEDDEFVTVLQSRDLYGVVGGPRIVMALTAVERSLRADKTELAPPPSNLSIEHVLPQSWETNWPLPSDAVTDPDEATKARDARLHRIGNLTVVAKPLNPALSNSPWQVKRGKLNDHSVLLLNSRLAQTDVWDEDAIDARGHWLATQLAAVWPGPGQSNWSL